MKILLFTSKFPPKIGGVENVCYNLAQEYIKKGHEVLVISSYEPNFSKEKGILNNLKSLKSGFNINSGLFKYKGINIQNIFMSLPRSVKGKLSFPIRFSKATSLISKEINNFNPDIIHYHFPDDSLNYFLEATKKLKTPIITNIHGNEIHLFSKDKSYKHKLEKLFNRSKYIVINSKYMLGETIKSYVNFEPKIKIIENGISLNNLLKKLPVINKDYSDYFLFVGRFNSKKNIELLIKAYNSISNNINKKLLIIGDSVGNSKDGALSMSYYKGLAKDNSKIYFLGKQDNSLVLSYMKNAHYCVFPSKVEPFGVVALESLSVNTPVILSDTGGFREIYNNLDDIGYLFENNNQTALENILLSADQEEYIKKDFDLTTYSWDNISNKYLDIFKI